MQKIMFNEPFGLQDASIDGSKTMTRRAVPERTQRDGLVYAANHPNDEKAYERYLLEHAPYKVGEVVAIAQRYRDIVPPLDNKNIVWTGRGWNNKMYVRADLCKRHVEVTGVDYQMLWDITDEDCMREGIIKIATPHLPVKEHYTYINSGMISETPKAAFAHLIRRLCGDSYWESDPYNYVFSFILKD